VITSIETSKQIARLRLGVMYGIAFREKRADLQDLLIGTAHTKG
jgi:hypothetical protein